MANETVTAPAAAEPDVFGEQFEFQDIFRVEADVINRRRRLAHDARGDLVLEKEAKDMDGRPVLRPNSNAGLVGLALSGGGIRSAAFCLGALQALNKNNVLDRVDYLILGLLVDAHRHVATGPLAQPLVARPGLYKPVSYILDPLSGVPEHRLPLYHVLELHVPSVGG